MTSTVAMAARRLKPIGLTACVILALTTTMAAAQAAPRSSPTSVDSRRASFAGTSFASEPNENVEVVGTLHVVTALVGSEQTGWVVNWSTNLAATSGAGQTTGDPYRGNGADRGFVLFPPGPPVRAASFETSFRLLPPGPPTHPRSPSRLLVNVAFDETGTVVDIHLSQGPIGGVDQPAQ